MSEARPETGFIAAMACLFGAAYAALIVMGLGIASVIADLDNPFSPLERGIGVGALVIAGIALVVWMLRHGLRRDNRLRPAPVFLAGLFSTLTYLVTALLISFIAGGSALASWGVNALSVVAGPSSLVVFFASAVSAWACFATLRWQARNADTKQFAPPED